MRKVFLFILIIISVNVYSQETRKAQIYIAPVTGIGEAEENAFFHEHITQGVIEHSFTIAKAKRSSDFMLMGRIEILRCVHDPMLICPVHLTSENQENIFYLDLIKASTKELIGQQFIIFTETNDSLNELITESANNLLSLVSDIPVNQKDFRGNWLYLGLYGLWAPMYYDNPDEIQWLNFGAGVEAEFNFVKYLSISLGAQFTQERNQDYIMEIPLSLKIVITPMDNLMLQPYGGVSYNFSLMGTTDPCEYAWFAGFQFGIKLGVGFLTIDPRYSMDYYESKVKTESDEVIEYKRHMMQLAVGYKATLFPKSKW